MLLILAGVTIATLMGDNGILTKATSSKTKTIHAEVYEGMQLETQSYLIEKNEGGYTGSLTDYLNRDESKPIIGENGIINVENLLGESKTLGNGTTIEEGDVYVLEETSVSTGDINKYKELEKVASVGNIKVGATNNEEEKNYKVVYYGKTESENEELGVLFDSETSSSSSETLEYAYLFSVDSNGRLTLNPTYSYNSLEETMISLVRNISLFNLYIISKQILENKNEQYLLNGILIGGIILSILGIDERAGGLIYKHLEVIGIPFVTNIESRMFSSLGYANSFAIIMATEILICCYKIQITKNKIPKVIYCIMIGLFAICLILSYSRTVIAMLAIMILAYVIFIKKKKIYLKISIATIIVICISYIIGLNFDKPLTIFENKENIDEVKREIYKVEPEKEYVFKFDIEASSRLESVENYSICIVEENKYYDTITTHKIEFGNFEGEKEIQFKSTKDTVKIAIYFNTNSDVGQKGLTIKSLNINGEKFPLSYCYLPTKLVERVQSFATNDKSVWERGIYFLDSIKIIKNNFIFGTGENGWNYNYKYIQSYVYSATECHSFILQIFINNGIIGFITLMMILIYVAIRIFQKRESINELDLAFILLTIHSFIDFNMSFYCVQVLWIILFFCAINTKNKVNIKSGKTSMVLNIGIIAVNILTIIFSIFTYKLKYENTKTIENIYNCILEQNYNEEIEQIKKYKEKEKCHDFNFELEVVDYSKINEYNIEYI